MDESELASFLESIKGLGNLPAQAKLKLAKAVLAKYDADNSNDLDFSEIAAAQGKIGQFIALHARSSGWVHIGTTIALVALAWYFIYYRDATQAKIKKMSADFDDEKTKLVAPLEATISVLESSVKNEKSEKQRAIDAAKDEKAAPTVTVPVKKKTGEPSSALGHVPVKPMRQMSDGGGHGHAVVEVEFRPLAATGGDAAAQKALLVELRDDAELAAVARAENFTLSLPLDAELRDGLFLEMRSQRCDDAAAYVDAVRRAKTLCADVRRGARYITASGERFQITARTPFFPIKGEKVYWYKDVGGGYRVMQEGTCCVVSHADGSVQVEYIPVGADGEAGDKRESNVGVAKLSTRPFTTRVIRSQPAPAPAAGAGAGAAAAAPETAAAPPMPALRDGSATTTEVASGVSGNVLTLTIPLTNPEIAAGGAFCARPREFLVEACETYELRMEAAETLEEAAQWGALLGLYRFRLRVEAPTACAARAVRRP